jgi:hypothetical protein
MLKVTMMYNDQDATQALPLKFFDVETTMYLCID